MSARFEPSFRYHGRARDMPTQERSVCESMFQCALDGHEIVTIGPSEVEVEFPLPPLLAKAFRVYGHVRPNGCRDAYIYGLRGPDGRCFYVGSTVRGLHERLAGHLSSARRGTNTNRRLSRRLLELGDQVEISLIDTVAESQRFVREYQTINEFLAKGIKLLNSQVAPRHSRSYYPKVASK